MSDFSKTKKEAIMDDGFLLETVLSSANDAIVITDKDGIIIKMSKAYAEFLGKDLKNCIGKHVTEVIENTRMHIVAKTKKAEIAQLQDIKGRTMVATRVPLKVDGEIVGAYGRVVFKDLRELKSMHASLLELEDTLSIYKSKFETLSAARYSIDDIIGNSQQISELKAEIIKASPSKSNVLILGESGTGKELFAHAIHNLSRRRNMPLISVNCASIPSELIESELFGYVGGAFTGSARNGKMGLFHAADKGTLFLDEIGDLPAHMQAKLLRAIQEGEVRRVGATSNEKVNVRIIAATNKDLNEMVEKGQFREDLYYRLNVINIAIPPLRERLEDMPMIVNELLLKISEKNGIIIDGIDEEALNKLLMYKWPGNIRELENVLERAAIYLSDDRIIHADNIMADPHKMIDNYAGEQLKVLLDKTEKFIIEGAIARNKGNKAKTARDLGISRTNLYEKMTKYQIKEQ